MKIIVATASLLLVAGCAGFTPDRHCPFDDTGFFGIYNPDCRQAAFIELQRGDPDAPPADTTPEPVGIADAAGGA